MKTIIFTDLDGSLLHSGTYSFDEAKPALELIRKQGIPLVLCSSKTRAELEVYRKRLHNTDPFIVENGGGVFVPRGYFSCLTGATADKEYIISSLGVPYLQIRKEFIRLRSSLQATVRGFGDMTSEEISALTGLSLEEAALARMREYGEPFFFEHGTDERFLMAIEESGLYWTQGKLYHLMGDHDKGRAVRILKKWYASEFGTITTIGLGDGFNDSPLLNEVDYPVLIRKDDGTHDPRINADRLFRTDGIGPTGWNEAVLRLLNK